MPLIFWMSHCRAPLKPAGPPDRRIDNDHRLWRIVLIVERDGFHRLAVLYSLPMAGTRPSDVIGIASLRDVLVPDSMQSSDLDHWFRPDQPMKLEARHFQHVSFRSVVSNASQPADTFDVVPCLTCIV
ncbi:hypothetical protein [Mesorhizobium sp. M0047]|uniref:hypothetical protein n=1 Tax=Mesorhizobium sp. M0047 TaxID=2956859 RepID=UPI0033356248